MGNTAALGPVVVGVNATTASDLAVDWAAEYAALTGRRLLAVHGTGFVGVRPNAQDLLEAELFVLEGGRAIVDAAVERARKEQPSLDASGVAEVGDPPSVLLEHAHDASVVVVGSRRDEAFRRLFGSVSLAVTRHTGCPLVVVRPHRHRAPAPPRNGVVLGVDGTSASRDAAAFAFHYASVHRMPLVVLNASWERLSRGSAALELLTYAQGRELTEEEELSIAETVAGLPEQYPDVEWSETHRTADPAEALIEASESAALVVVGARRIGMPKALLLRSVSTALVEHAHCPVAVVQAS